MWLPQDEPIETAADPDCRASLVNPAGVLSYPGRVFRIPKPGMALYAVYPAWVLPSVLVTRPESRRY
jgi:hypothetical protein